MVIHIRTLSKGPGAFEEELLLVLQEPLFDTHGSGDATGCRHVRQSAVSSVLYTLMPQRMSYGQRYGPPDSAMAILSALTPPLSAGKPLLLSPICQEDGLPASSWRRRALFPVAYTCQEDGCPAPCRRRQALFLVAYMPRGWLVVLIPPSAGKPSFLWPTCQQDGLPAPS